MLKNTAPIQQAAKPSLQAVRRAVASSTALETGLTVKQLEQKLQNRRQHRFHTSSCGLIQAAPPLSACATSRFIGAYSI